MRNGCASVVEPLSLAGAPNKVELVERLGQLDPGQSLSLSIKSRPLPCGRRRRSQYFASVRPHRGSRLVLRMMVRGPGGPSRSDRRASDLRVSGLPALGSPPPRWGDRRRCRGGHLSGLFGLRRIGRRRGG